MSNFTSARLAAATLGLAWLQLGASLSPAAVPAVSISLASNRVARIEWPAADGLLQLQTADTLPPGANWHDVPQAPVYIHPSYRFEVSSGAGPRFYRLRQVIEPEAGSVPDPSGLAPAPTPNLFAHPVASVAFLYAGSNAVQFGVAPGTISAERGSVLRGRVRVRDQSPLAGVRVSVLNHPEFGYTYTRSNGFFDLAVNADTYTIDYRLRGYCPVQRSCQAPAQDFRALPDVVMIAMDPVATPVDFGPAAPAQLATSSTQTDGRGTRSASIYFPTGTCASIVLPDGSVVPCQRQTIRVTEFTVGASGPAAMPGPLPPTTAYTYCAEFSGDEAAAVGAKTIQFNQRVPVYVDNFLDAPVGAAVPAGEYDRFTSRWIPYTNGIVLKIVGVTGGIAQIDLHGTGQPEAADGLASIGVTPEELTMLAGRYPVGKTLWRMPLPHFCPIDFNFGSAGPDANKPNKNGDKPKGDPCDTSGMDWGVFNFSQQTFTEEIPLAGVPFQLHYSSERVPGYRVNNHLTIPVTWEPPPNPCAGAAQGGRCEVPPHYYSPPQDILVQAEIAGHLAEQVLAITNDIAVVDWDGTDAYGRLIGGSRVATITVSYEFPWLDYGLSCCGPDVTARFPALFGNYGDSTQFLGHSGPDWHQNIGAQFQQLLTYPDHRHIGLGGWSLTPHHSFDPVGGILYYGDGRVRKVPGASGLDNRSPIAPLAVSLVAAAADGGYYCFGDFPTARGRIFRVFAGGQRAFVTPADPTFIDPASPVVTPARQGWAAADGLPQEKVAILNCNAMALGPDGSLFILDAAAGAIARLSPAGIWNVLVGLGPHPAPYPLDGTDAKITFTSDVGRNNGLAIGPDGSVFFGMYWSSVDGLPRNAVRKISADGKISTVYGDGGILTGATTWRDSLGTPAQSARSPAQAVYQLAAGPDGSLVIDPQLSGPQAGMFKVSPTGMLQPLLNSGVFAGPGYGLDPTDTNNLAFIKGDEGKLATNVNNNLASWPALPHVGADGSVYFVQNQFGILIWRITPDGHLERVAGKYNNPTYETAYNVQDGADPLQTFYPAPSDMALAPDGSLMLVLGSAQPLIAIIPARSSANHAARLVTLDDQFIPSEDGSEIYVFNGAGTHLRTLNSLTGAPIYAFDYDTNNVLTRITDAAGNVTRIEHDNAGQPTAIVGPYGQRTTLTVDTHGFLSLVVNPANETTTLSSTPGGLLSSIAGPRGNVFEVTYDALGLATGVTDPNGGGWRFTHADVGLVSNGYEVRVGATNSLGGSASRQLLLQPDSSTYVNYFTGLRRTRATTTKRSGDFSSVYADGSTLEIQMGPDPRFGAQVRLPGEEFATLPGQIQRRTTTKRTASLANPDDPLSLTNATTTTTVNGRTRTVTWSASTRTLTATSPEGRLTSSLRDALGRVVGTSSPGRPPVTLTYDANGRLATVTEPTSLGLRGTTNSYNAQGQLARITDALGQSSAFQYDAAGRLTEATLADGGTAHFSFDAEDHVTTIAPPGRPAHSYTYDAVGNITRYTPPNTGADESVAFTFDSERNLSRIDYPDGQQARFTRGLAGRVEQIALGSGPQLTCRYGAQDGQNLMQLTNVAITDGGGSIALGYAGPFVTNLAWAGAITGAVAIAINPDFRVASWSVNGAPIPCTYDGDGLLTQAGTLAIFRNPSNGWVQATTLAGITDERIVNDRGLLHQYVARANGATVWSIAYQYDLLDRITNRIESVAGGATRTVSYDYDAAGRLRHVWKNGALDASYTYDPNGNRLTRNSETATYDVQDRLGTYAGAVFNWSPNGWMRSRTAAGQTTTYTYDLRGVLVSAGLPGGQTIDYVNDPAGQRTGRKVNGVLQKGWLWNGFRPVAELDSSSSVTARFVYGADGLTPSYVIKGAETYRLLSDERGSVRFVIRVSDGTVAQQIDYDEFGRVLLDTAPGFQPFGYAGGLYDPDTGLVRFGARDYSAETGQWLGRDPVGFAGGSLSLYAYVKNDPINAVDPLGAGPFGNWAWSNGKTVLGIVANGAALVGGLYLLPEAAAAFAVYQVVNSGMGLIGNLVNQGANNAGANVNTSFPDSIPQLVVYVSYGGKPSRNAQNVAAAADLCTSLHGLRQQAAKLAGNPADMFGGARNLADGVSQANDAVSAVDKGGTALGLTPGSKPPNCP